MTEQMIVGLRLKYPKGSNEAIQAQDYFCEM